MRLRTGWFSDRSATYLASGRPVVTQDTGFGDALPTGQALDAEVVLARLVEQAGVSLPSRRGSRAESTSARPPARSSLAASDGARAGDTRAAVTRPLPPPRVAVTTNPRTSIVVVTLDNLAFTRLCVETVLATTDDDVELIVAENGSADEKAGTTWPSSRLATGVSSRLASDSNLGFAAAVNQGLAAARGGTLVVLNNDTVLPPGWLARLERYLADPEVGTVGPTTNDAGNEAEVEATYRTYGELLDFAARARG